MNKIMLPPNGGTSNCLIIIAMIYFNLIVLIMQVTKSFRKQSDINGINMQTNKSFTHYLGPRQFYLEKLENDLVTNDKPR